MIVDSHLHLDEKVDGTALGAAIELNSQLEGAGVDRAVVLHLEVQPWSPETFAEAISAFPRMRGFINVHPYQQDADLQLRYGIETLGYIGLKLHPRLQKFDFEDERVLRLIQFAGEMKVPVLVDAFPDGTHILEGFSPVKFANVAIKCPNTRIVVAHMGGHYVLDFLMLAKRIPNLYFDFSYSLLYYQGSAVPGNMIYAMKSLNFRKVFYGSDYPDRPINVSLERSREILLQHGLQDEDMSTIMGGNAVEFFDWNER